MCLTPKTTTHGNKLINLDYEKFSRNKLDITVDDSLNDYCAYLDYEEYDELSSKGQNLSIIQLNIRGLLSKLNDISSLIRKGNENKIGAVLLCETWVRAETKKLVSIPGYDIFSKERVGKKVGGVGILLDEQLVGKRRPDLEISSSQYENIVVELKSNAQNILLVSGYRAPNTSQNDFITDFMKHVDLLNETKMHVTIGIDHNMDLLKCSTQRNTQHFFEQILGHKLIPCITKPTRITHSSATLIDNIFCSIELHHIAVSGLIITDLSDHLPCLSVFDSVLPTTRKEHFVLKRKITEKKIEKIRSDLQHCDWKTVLRTGNCEDKFQVLHSILITSLNKHAPEVKCKIKGKHANTPWLTKGLQKCLNKQKKLFKSSIKIDGASVTPKSVDNYKMYRSMLQCLLRHTKLKYYHDQCLSFKSNTKKLWELINSIIKKQMKKTDLIEYLTIDQIQTYDCKKIAEEFGKHFATVGKKLAGNMSPSKNDVNHYVNKIPTVTNSLYLSPTSEKEIKDLIQSLSNKNSSGYDNISNVLLKKLSPAIVTPLNIIFNSSLSEGKFPQQMKLAEVVPLHKNSCRSLPSNYRPISLLITISKLLEKVIYKRTYGFLEKEKALYKSQYGFRSKHSCEQAVCELLSEIIKNNDKDQITMTVYLDLSKAFDTLDHTLLLKKLEKYGIRGVALSWYKSYLTARTLKSKVNTSDGLVYSKPYDIEYGTPQGSCLGPLLFLLFTNDLHLHLMYSSCILFADDTTIFYSGKSIRYIEWCIREDLKILQD